MKKFFATILLCLTAALAAQAQIHVYNDYGNSTEWSRGDWASRDEVINACSELLYSSDRTSCYQIVSEGSLTRSALRMCTGLFYSADKLSCLRKSKNKYFQSSAVQFCQGLTYSSDASNCMSIIANKYYENSEIRACEKEFYSSDKLNCMSRFGQSVGSGYPRDPYPRDPYPRDPYPRDPYPRDPYPRDPYPREPLNCEVHNSNSYITTVRRTDFEAYARRFAQQERSCVVSNYYNDSYSRVLWSESGRRLGANLSESEASELKSQYGYSRCRILTCK